MHLPSVKVRSLISIVSAEAGPCSFCPTVMISAKMKSINNTIFNRKSKAKKHLNDKDPKPTINKIKI